MVYYDHDRILVEEFGSTTNVITELNDDGLAKIIHGKVNEYKSWRHQILVTDIAFTRSATQEEINSALIKAMMNINDRLKNGV